MLGKRIINTATGAAPSACTTDTVQILDGVPFESIATYQLDGNANDLTTNYNGTWGGTEAYTTGQFGQAAVFNGSSSYIDTSIPLNSNLGSVSLWVKTSDTTATFFGVNANSDSNRFYFGVRNSNFWTGAGNLQKYTVSASNLIDNNWHNVVITLNGSVAKYYLDGAEVDSTSYTGQGSLDLSPVIGGIRISSGINSSYYTNGSIDQVRIFNTALSAGAITNLYNETVATASNTYISLPSLVAYYKMSDATDETGSYDGTPTNVNFNVAGKFGNAGSFNGASSFIAVPAGLRKNNNFTASIWFNTNSTTDGQSLISFRNGKKFEVVLNNSNVGNGSIRVNAGNNTAVDSAAGIFTTNTWYNLVVVQSSVSGVTVYLNNSVVASNSGATGDLVTVTGLDSIGAYNNNGSFFNGSIDQFRYFNRAITANEVTTLYDEVQCIPTIVPSEHFNPVIYTGDGTTNNPITSLDFQPDLVWIKNRNSTQSHRLYDSVRGANLQISSNQTAAESNSGGLTSFDSNGFSLDNWASVNTNNNTYVAWNFKAGGADVLNEEGTIDSQVSANTEAGFSVVKYSSGASATGTVGHGLTQPPQIVLQKGLGVDSWFFANNLVNGGTNYEYLILNTTDAQSTNWTFWDGADAPNSTTFKNGWDGNREMINYCFHSVDGFSKFGSYVGTGASGNAVVTGFEPAFLLVKQTNTARNWYVMDNKRNPENPKSKLLFPNDAGAEFTGSGDTFVDFLENGFEITPIAGDAINQSGGTYIFMAFAADPTTIEPTLEDSFDTVTYTGNGGTKEITSLDFQPDLVWIKERTSTSGHFISDSIRGATKVIYSNLTNSEDTETNVLTSFDTNGFTVGNSPGVNAGTDDYVAWNWKAAELPAINNNGSIPSVVSANPAAGFSIVKWTADGNGFSSSIGHGLNAAPELIITKDTDTSNDWIVTSSLFSNPTRNFLKINLADAVGLSSVDYYDLSASTFKVGVRNLTVGKEIISYCFHSVDGYQKVGSYTGTGLAGNIVYTDSNGDGTGTGAFQPRFVMIKCTSAIQGWSISDSVRSPNNPVDIYLTPHTSYAEESGNAWYNLNYNSNGFTVNGSDNFSNGNGQTYIYLAIA